MTVPNAGSTVKLDFGHGGDDPDGYSKMQRILLKCDPH